MLDSLKKLLGRKPASDAIDSKKIIPLVKATISDPSGRGMKIPEDQQPILRPFVGELILAYVVDEETAFRFLNRADLNALNMTEEQLHDLALRNLPARVPEVQVHGNYPQFMVSCGGNLEATCLLLEDLW